MGRQASKLDVRSGVDWLRLTITDFQVESLDQLDVYPDRYVPDRVLFYLSNSTPVVGERAIIRAKGIHCLIMRFKADTPAILLVRWNPTTHKTLKNWPLLSIDDTINRISVLEAQLLSAGVTCKLLTSKVSALEYAVDIRHIVDHHVFMSLIARTGLQPYMNQLHIEKALPVWFNKSASFSIYSKSRQKPAIRQRLSQYSPVQRVLRHELRLKNAISIRERLGYHTLRDAVDDRFQNAESLFLEYQKRALWLALKKT